MIFQDPMTSLNPVLTIGRQIREALETHFGMDKDEAERARRRAARPGRHPERRGAAQRLPAPVLRRDAPARDDRDGAGVRAEAPDRRRADDGARRHDPGADPRPPARARRRAGHGADPDHARPRRRRRHVRARERHVRGHVHGDGHGRAALRAPAAPVHARPAAERPAARRRAQDSGCSRSRATRATCSSRRRRARSRRAAATRSSSRARRCRRSGDRAGPPGRLLQPGAGRRVAANAVEARPRRR